MRRPRSGAALRAAGAQTVQHYYTAGDRPNARGQEGARPGTAAGRAGDDGAVRAGQRTQALRAIEAFTKAVRKGIVTMSRTISSAQGIRNRKPMPTPARLQPSPPRPR